MSESGLNEIFADEFEEYPIIKFEVKDKYNKTISRIAEVNKKIHKDYNWLIHKINIHTGELVNNCELPRKVIEILGDCLPEYKGNTSRYCIHSNYLSEDEDKQLMCEADNVIDTDVIINNIYKSSINKKAFIECKINPEDTSIGRFIGTIGKIDTIEIFSKEEYLRPVKIESCIIDSRLICEKLSINMDLRDLDNSYKIKFKFEINDEMIDTIEKIHKNLKVLAEDGVTKEANTLELMFKSLIHDYDPSYSFWIENAFNITVMIDTSEIKTYDIISKLDPGIVKIINNFNGVEYKNTEMIKDLTDHVYNVSMNEIVGNSWILEVDTLCIDMNKVSKLILIINGVDWLKGRII